MSDRHSVRIQSIMAALPQAQCRQCGFSGCWPYARAIVRGQAPLDLCIPGGTNTEQQLRTLCGQAAPADAKPLPPPPEAVAIDADACIGCGRCLPVCPVDAIAGAVGYLHVVLPRSCTGCRLCVASCPVDCFVQAPEEPLATADTARLRHARKARRLRRNARPESRRIARERKEREIADALTRVKARRGWQRARATVK